MIIKKAEEIQDGDILAKDIILDGEILIPKKTALKTSYISNLKELNLDLICVEELQDALKSDTDREIFDKYLPKVSEVMASLMHGNTKVLQELKYISEKIVEQEINHFQESTKIVISNREADLFKHSISVCRMSVIAALHMGLSKEVINELAYGALIHDVGYRYVTAVYQNIELDTLSPGEIFDIKKHTIYAFSSLEAEEWISPLQKRIILSHHERADGSGYPLKQRNLDKEIWIVAICDAIDSLVSGMACILVEPKEALETMRSCRNTFDPEVFDMIIDKIETAGN